MANIVLLTYDDDGTFVYEIDGIPFAYKIDPARIQTWRNLRSFAPKKAFNFIKKHGARLLDYEDSIWNTNPDKPYERWRIGEKVIVYIGINPDTNGKAVIFEALSSKGDKTVVRIKLNLGSEIDKLKWIVKERL